MQKLWQKNWQLNKDVEEFETEDDIALDGHLAYFDVLASLAHAKMLYKIGILKKSELAKLQQGFRKILKLIKAGDFELKIGDEDIHTKIESWLTKNYGEVGKKIHTGRSRNDQVLTALRLFTKDGLLGIQQQTLTLAAQFKKFAIKYRLVQMPGYTHMQKAMPSSVGIWAGSFAEALYDDARVIAAAVDLIDQSPLGSAAGYGVPLKLDRTLTAKLLGFKKVQSNAMYCQNSRGKFEAVVIAALVNALSDINRFASDLMLFTTAEFNFFTVDAELCSGSSIMPQKRNLDLAELLRSVVKKVTGNYLHVAALPFDLPSGYNRDLQNCKKPLIESIKATKRALNMTSLLLSGIRPNKKVMGKACTPELFAAHQAFKLVREGMSFRDAYHAVGAKMFDPMSKNQ